MDGRPERNPVLLPSVARHNGRRESDPGSSDRTQWWNITVPASTLRERSGLFGRAANSLRGVIGRKESASAVQPHQGAPVPGVPGHFPPAVGLEGIPLLRGQHPANEGGGYVPQKNISMPTAE